jgi:ATP-dependent Zn protease
MDHSMWNMLFLNWVPLLLLFVVLATIRMRQEQAQREIDALRRHAHAM